MHRFSLEKAHKLNIQHIVAFGKATIKGTDLTIHDRYIILTKDGYAKYLNVKKVKQINPEYEFSKIELNRYINIDLDDYQESVFYKNIDKYKKIFVRSGDDSAYYYKFKVR